MEYVKNKTIVDVLKERALLQPNDIAFRFLSGNGNNEDILTYQELDLWARRVAACIINSGNVGDRVILLVPPSLQYIASFFGCLYAGRVAVPLYPPKKTDKHSRVASVIHNCGARIAISFGRAYDAILPSLLESGIYTADQFLNVDEMPESSIDVQADYHSGQELAFLQYTSGSTGAPKGVMISHRNIVENAHALLENAKCRQDDVFVNWLPLFHDLGLITTLVLPVYLGAESIIMSPVDFISQPYCWLNAITKYKGTVCGAPNFAYDLCIKRISQSDLATLDLSTWRVAYNAAEPIRAETLRAFSNCFETVGFDRKAIFPAYGMAEATVFISGGSKATQPFIKSFSKEALKNKQAFSIVEDSNIVDVQELVGCGEVPAGHHVVIVDPDTKCLLPQSEVGEIWFQGPSVGLGYWGLPDATEETFCNLIEGRPELGEYLRTGDLGFICDNEIFVVGRIKDVVIINGANFYPQDIELVSERVIRDQISIGISAVFSVEQNNEEHIVLILEVKLKPSDDTEFVKLYQSIVSKISEEFGVELNTVVFVKAGSIPRTSSGKVQRANCKRMFLENQLTELSVFSKNEKHEASVLPKFISKKSLSGMDSVKRLAFLESMVRAEIYSATGGIATNFDTDTSLFALGMSSLKALQLQSDLEQQFDISISAAELLLSPTLGNLVRLINDAIVTPIQTMEFNQPIVCENRMTEGQRSLWAIHQQDPNSHAYNLYTAVKSALPIDLMAMQRALDALVVRHESLRTVFPEKDGQPTCQIQSLAYISLDAHSEITEDEVLSQKVINLCKQPFDLENGPLFKLSVIPYCNGHVMVFNIHHIIADFRSVDVLVQELGILYTNFKSGKQSDLHQVESSFQQYIQWQTNYLEGSAADKAAQFWQEKVDNQSFPTLQMPTDFKPPVAQTFNGAYEQITIESTVKEKLKKLSNIYGVTLNAFLFTAYQILLTRYSNQAQFAIGVPFYGREIKRFSKVVGFCVNTLPVTCRYDAKQPLIALVKENFAELMQTLVHQSYPFSKVVSLSGEKRDPSKTPLFQALFVYQNSLISDSLLTDLVNAKPDAEIVFGDLLRVTPINVPLCGAQFELAMELVDSEHDLTATLKFNTDLFKRETAQRLLADFSRILESLGTDPLKPSGKLTFLDIETEFNLLHRWNDTDVSFDENALVHSLFENNVLQYPRQTAVVFDGCSISYEELNSKSNRVAHYLIEKGCTPDTLVGLCTLRSFEMIIGILGILKAGGAYVPIEPSYPQSRIDYLIGDSGVQIVLTQASLISIFQQSNAILCCLDTADFSQYSCSSPKPHPDMDSKKLAYMIYTSGSTGNPKGVMVEHKALVNRLCWMKEKYAFNHHDRILQKTPYSFDVSVWELLLPLISGARLVFALPEGHKDATYLSSLIAQEQITSLHFVPSMLSAMLEDFEVDCFGSVSRIFCSGEALSVNLQSRFFQKTKNAIALHNLYGPTEAAIDVTFWQCQPDHHAKTVPIGQPIDNIQLYVLDNDLNLVPFGGIGELYLGGIGLARGYKNKPELTKNTFISNPFSDSSGARIYKTGDLVRWIYSEELNTSVIEYLGRADHQIKIRGFRVELSEIEAICLSLDTVSDAVVIEVGDAQNKALAAYIVSSAFQEDTFAQQALAEDFRFKLETLIPEYMVPAYIQVLHTLPLTSNGKVDRNALPKPQRLSCAEFNAPNSEAELIFAKAWADILQIELIKLSIDDNYFALGGDSIKAISIVSLLKKQNIRVSVSDIFKYKTIRNLAANTTAYVGDDSIVQPFSLLSESLVQQFTDNAEDAYPLSALQQGMAFHSQYEENSLLYHDVFSFHIAAKWDESLFAKALMRVIDSNPVMRASFSLDSNPPIQIIHRTIRSPLEVFDISDVHDKKLFMSKFTEEEKHHSIKLNESPLFRIFVHVVSPSEFYYTISFHHAILDGWSVASLNTVLFSSYLSNSYEEQIIVNRLHCHFVKQEIAARENHATLEYWQRKLTGAKPLQLTAKNLEARRSKIVRNKISAPITHQLKNMAIEWGVSLSQLLLSAHIRVVSLISGTKDVVTSIVSNGRAEEHGSERALGLFLNSLPIRVNANVSTWNELVSQVSEESADILPHRYLPFADIQQKADIDLSSLLFNYNNFHVYDTLVGNDAFKLLDMDIFEENNFKIYVNFQESVVHEHITLELTYQTEYFNDAEIEQLLRLYEVVIESVVQNDYMSNEGYMDSDSLAKIQSLRATPYNTKFDDWMECFVRQVDETPRNTALKTHDESLTYEELNKRANQVAHYLSTKGVVNGDMVGVSLPRSADLLIILLAINKVGAAFVPLDESYPKERLVYMVEHSGLKYMLTHRSSNIIRLDDSVKRINIDDTEFKNDLRLCRSDNCEANGIRSKNTAYVIYTSGSTGKPKGVQVSNRNLSNFLSSMKKALGIVQSDKLLAITPISFDIHALELFLPLQCGATVYIADSDHAKSASAIETLIISEDISVMQATPATWSMLLYNGWRPSHRMKILCGGEALTDSLKQKLLLFSDKLDLWNMYGPTETTVWSSATRITDPVHITNVIGNTSFYILDDALDSVLVGVPGELYIGGEGVSLGYLHNESLSRERFIDLPSLDHLKVYRTGDIVVLNHLGHLTYLRRADDQVKVRGYRIEIGEIEHQLNLLPEVKQAVVVAVSNAGSTELVGHVLTYSENPNLEMIRVQLANALPDYMLPSRLIHRDSLPLSPSGKIDRNELKNLSIGLDSGVPYVAPTNAIEEFLCEQFSQLFAIKSPSTLTNFFAVGGQSLLAVRVVSDVRQRLQIELPIKALFEYPTISSLAEYITREGRKSKLPVLERCTSDNTGLLPVSNAQYRIWLLDKIENGSTQYNLSARYHLRGDLDIGRLEQSLKFVIQEHEVIRMCYCEKDGTVYGRVQEAYDVTLTVRNLTGESVLVQRDILESNFQILQCRSFDLSSDLMLRAEVDILNEGEYVVSVCMHHIAADGWSVGVLIDAINKHYNRLASHESNTADNTRIQYTDYVRWQKEIIERGALSAEIIYWQDVLAQSPAKHNLPIDYARPATQSFEGNELKVQLSQSMLDSIQSACRLHNVTLFIFLETLFALLVARYSAEQDVVIGTPVAGRLDKNTENIIGLFVNSLAIRTRINNRSTFAALLQENRSNIVDAFSNQYLPFDKLLEYLEVGRSTSYSPIFQLFFTLHNNQDVELNLTGVSANQLESKRLFSRFDLELEAQVNSEGLSLTWIYNRTLFEESTIDAFARSFNNLLDAALDSPDVEAGKLALLDTKAIDYLTNGLNDTSRSVDFDYLIHERIQYWADNYGRNIAIVDDNVQLTYTELNRKANQFARYLITQGAMPEQLIGVCTSRSVNMIIAILAILKSGAAYVPIDPEYPQQRIKNILADSQPLLLICDEESRYKVRDYDRCLLVDVIDELSSRNSAENIDRMQIQLKPDNLAYVIYTSGSTGKPKGVMVEHRNLVNFTEAMTDFIGEERGVWLAATSLSFDISVFEILSTLSEGYKVVVAQSQKMSVNPQLANQHKKIDFSLFYFSSDEGASASNKYDLLIKGAQFADKNLFKAVWTPERHFGQFGGLYPNPAVTGAAVAAVTEHVEIRAGSCVLPLHNEIRVVEDWSVVDNLSNGRVGIAFAAGWQPDDFVIAPGNFAERNQSMPHRVTTVKSLWRGEEVFMHGHDGVMRSVLTKPRPIQSELPVWLTVAGNPAAFRAAGIAGYNILTHLLGQSLEEVSQKIQIYRDAWQEAGHSGRGCVTLMMHTFITDDLNSAMEKVEKPFKTYLKQSLTLLEGSALAMGLKLNDLTEENLELLLDAAFKRYATTGALFGTPESTLKLVDEIKGCDVDEVACLVDFGIDSTDVLENLQHLNQLRRNANLVKPVTQSLEMLMQTHQVTHFQCTPSLLGNLLELGDSQYLENLRYLYLGGEALPPKLLSNFNSKIAQAFGKIQVRNMYGPTETTIWSTTYLLTSPDQPVLIGKPIINTQVYVVDKFNQPCPVGVVGELLIGGAGVTRGYLNNPELTTEKFVELTHLSGNSQPIYRTGDLACWSKDGNLKYCGRNDTQVKLRGFRIELAEIEHHLSTIEDVKEAAVIIRDISGMSQLIAFVTLNSVLSDAQVSLKNALSSRVPDFMVPAFIVVLDAMPQTQNGKLDRKSLPLTLNLEAAVVLPTNEVEARLVEIWRSLLGLSSLSIDDNFFELGGHSVAGTKLISMVRNEFAVEVPLKTLFEAPTIRQLAARFASFRNQSVLSNIPVLMSREHMPLSYSQQRLWVVDQLAGGSVEYNKQGVIRLVGTLDIAVLRRSVMKIIDRHEVLRTSFFEFEGEPVQSALSDYELPMQEADLSGFNSSVQEEKLNQIMIDDALKPFDLTKDLKLRTHLVKLNQMEFILIVNMHHIAADAGSLQILTREMSLLYSSLKGYDVRELPQLDVQYADYAKWQRDWINSEKFLAQKTYWLNNLSSAPAVHGMPTDKPRPAVLGKSGAAFYCAADEQLFAKITKRCKEQNVTLFVMLQSLYSLLIGLHSSSDDIVIGSPVSGRITEKLEPLIGFFVNTVVLRNQLTRESSVSSWLQSCKQVVVNALANQDVPFDFVVEDLNPKRSMAYSPVFQLWFVLQNYADTQVSLPGVEVVAVAPSTLTSLFELTLDITEMQTSLHMNWTYNTELFTSNTIEELASDYMSLLHEVCDDSSQSVQDLFNKMSQIKHQRRAKLKEQMQNNRVRQRVRRQPA